MMSANAGQIHRRPDGVCELLVNANQFFFQGPEGIT